MSVNSILHFKSLFLHYIVVFRTFLEVCVVNRDDDVCVDDMHDRSIKVEKCTDLSNEND